MFWAAQTWIIILHVPASSIFNCCILLWVWAEFSNSMQSDTCRCIFQTNSMCPNTCFLLSIYVPMLSIGHAMNMGKFWFAIVKSWSMRMLICGRCYSRECSLNQLVPKGPWTSSVFVGQHLWGKKWLGINPHRPLWTSLVIMIDMINQ